MSVEKCETCTARCPWRFGAPFSSASFGGQLCLGASRLPWETALPDARVSGFCLVLWGWIGLRGCCLNRRSSESWQREKKVSPMRRMGHIIWMYGGSILQFQTWWPGLQMITECRERVTQGREDMAKGLRWAGEGRARFTKQWKVLLLSPRRGVRQPGGCFQRPSPGLPAGKCGM